MTRITFRHYPAAAHYRIIERLLFIFVFCIVKRRTMAANDGRGFRKKFGRGSYGFVDSVCVF